jgi:hypothetical protein
MAERLSGINVRNMHLYKRNLKSRKRIANRNARVRESAGVDDDKVDLSASFVDSVDDRALVVGLEGIQGSVCPRGYAGAVVLDLF